MKRLTVAGADRSKGTGVLRPAGQGLSSTTLAPEAGRDSTRASRSSLASSAIYVADFPSVTNRAVPPFVSGYPYVTEQTD